MVLVIGTLVSYYVVFSPFWSNMVNIHYGPQAQAREQVLRGTRSAQVGLSCSWTGIGHRFLLSSSRGQQWITHNPEQLVEAKLELGRSQAGLWKAPCLCEPQN